MAASLAIIGGTGLSELPGFSIKKSHSVATPLGQTSAPVIEGELNGTPVFFLARHGRPHRVPPHLINYRANIWALKNLGVTDVLAINAVGGISPVMSPGKLVLASQIIDYTYGRDHTFFDGVFEPLHHIDFSQPYSAELKAKVMRSAQYEGLDLVVDGTYGATQGPRLETAAEITRMERDGCDIVGMTGMPEAALACEMQLNYANLSLVVNRAAGKTDEILTLEMMQTYLTEGMERIGAVITRLAADCF
jgi:5'-methylthioinosine phosphorylase